MNNKRLRALVGIGIVSATMAFANIADAATKYAKTTANLNFRTGPSTSNKIISTIKKNTKVEVISYEGKWAKIKYNNKVGYSSKSYLSEISSSSSTSSGTTTTTKIGTVTADALNVRSGAGTKYSKIGTLKKGAKVTILSSSNGWYKIQYTSSKTGWVSGSYIKVTTTTSNSGGSSNGSSSSGNTSSGSTSSGTTTTTKTGTVTADELNVRSGAGTKYSKIGTLKKGATVTILSSSNGWYKIQYTSSKTGWVSGSYIKVTTTTSNSGSSSNGSSNSGSTSSGNTSSGNTSSGTTTTTKTGTVTADELNVRSGAGTSYSIIGTLKKGAKVTILSTSNGWHKIQYTSSKTGWVSASYVSTGNNSTNSGSSSSGSSNSGSTTQPALPTPIEIPTYVDAPVNSLVMDPQYDQYQNLLTMDAVKNDGLKSLSVKSNGDFGISYSVYANGSWKSASNGTVASNGSSTIEGVRISLTNAPTDYHIFYRVKVAGQGWQNWVKDNTISGEISVNKTIEDIEIRLVVSDNTDSMVKETIAVDLGHNVLRPTTRGAVNGIYEEDYLNREITKQVVYKLRSLGYNVVETIPSGLHTQSNELKLRYAAANANEVDKFVSIHFNSGTTGANGTEVYYATRGNSKTLATNVVNNIASSFNFKNRGAKDGSHLAVLKNTTMPAILVEGCFLDQIDMDKFIAKGSSAYSIMADDIVNGIIK